MLNRDFASVTANIIKNTRPEMTAPKQDNWGEMLGQAVQNYQTAKYKNDASEALASGDMAGFESNLARLNPIAAVNYKLQQQKEEQNNKYKQFELALKRQALEQAKEIAMIKASGNGSVNINMNNPFDKKRIENIAKNMDENISTSQERINSYNEAEDLLNKGTFDTGGIHGMFTSLTTPFNDDAAQFNALVNKIVPTMRPAGSGSTSDKDMAIFEKATFGFNKPKEANLNIIRGRRAADENSIAKEELRAAYVTNGLGTLSDFDREWKRYLDANPIFGDKEGNTLNKSRKDAYSWFNDIKREDSTPTRAVKYTDFFKE